MPEAPPLRHFVSGKGTDILFVKHENLGGWHKHRLNIIACIGKHLPTNFTEIKKQKKPFLTEADFVPPASSR